jgi:sialate O-acetylesterase
MLKSTRPTAKISCLLVGALVLAGGSAFAQPPHAAAPLPFVSPIFGDNMVLQRDKPNGVWGWSQPGDSVRVEIGEHSATATAAADGKWQARIQPPAAGGPYTVKIAGGSQTLELHDVLVDSDKRPRRSKRRNNEGSRMSVPC